MQFGSSLPASIAVARTNSLPWLAATTMGAAALLTVAFAEAAALPGAGGRAYTADEHGASLSAVDLATGEVTTTVMTISPHNIQVTPDGALLLAVGEPASKGHGHGAAEAGHRDGSERGLLVVLSSAAPGDGAVAQVPVGAHPAHVVTDREGTRAFVTNSGDNSVSVVDLRTGSVVKTIGTGAYPHGLRVSPQGGEAYVANVEDGTLSVIDTASLAEVARIPVGKTPVQVGFTPDGSQVFVSLRDENRVAVVDTASRSMVRTIEVGRNPIQVHATPDGRFVYVANQGTASEPDETVSVIDVARGEVIETIRTGKGAHGVAVSEDGAFVFVTNIVDSTLAVIDTETRTVLTTFAVGAGPNGVTYRPAED
jgi:YVTN family beta-propeller protein